MCLPTLKRSFFNIKLQEKDGDMQLCHQIDEEEVLDIDESVTILDLIKTFLSKTRLCNQ